MTGAVNYEQFVQLLNWRDHPLSQEGRTKDTNGLSIISRSSCGFDHFQSANRSPSCDCQCFTFL